MPLGNVPTAVGFRQGLISLSSELPSVAVSYPTECIGTQDHGENVWFTVKAPVQVLSALMILAKLLSMFALHVSVLLTVRREVEEATLVAPADFS